MPTKLQLSTTRTYLPFLIAPMRRLVLIDRGKRKANRYLANLKVDEIQEGTLSYLKVDGKLTPKK